jgi:PAS domain S-box-containing protein
MKRTVSHPPVALVRLDEHGMIVELDRAAEEVFGVRSEEARGRPISELFVREVLSSPCWIRARSLAPDEPGRRFSRAGESQIELAIGRMEPDELRSPAGVQDVPQEGEPGAEPALEALLERAEGLALIGSWDWDLDVDQLRWSDNLYRLFGLEPGEIVPTDRYVVERAHPGDRERIERAAEIARKDGLIPPMEFRITRPDGTVRHFRATQTIVEKTADQPRRMVGSVQDITEGRRAERVIAAHLAVANALSKWRTLEQGGTGLLRELVVALDCALGVLWVREGDVLVARVLWRSGSAEVSELESAVRELRLPRGVGLAGEVWERGAPRHVPSFEGDARYPAKAVAGLGGAVALPALHGQEVLAVVELHLCEPLGGGAADRLMRSLTSIGHELGEFLVHRRGELKPSALTPRELEVLQLAAQGFGGRQIAERLVLSPATVRTHFEHIYEKYGVSDRASAVAKALRDGIID